MNQSEVVMVVAKAITLLESSSDESDEDVFFMRYFEEAAAAPKQNNIRIKNYLENVVHLYTNANFKTHFRMNRSTFDHVLNLLGPLIEKKSNNIRSQGRDPISPEKQLLITIWTLATPDSYRSVCDRFDVGKATGLRAVRRVIRALLKFKSQFIKWPSIEESNEIMASYENGFGFPGVVGCVDGTHIKIAAPKDNPTDYINRKGYHSIQLQVTCDNTRKIIHCYTGSPGSMHDHRIYKKSGLDEVCGDENKFPNNSHLLGDAAYCISRHLMVPYKDNGRLTNIQKNFNNRLSSTRMSVERSIGLLKGRFRILLDRLDVKRTDLIPYYIMACCVLHNICLGLNDHIDVPIIVNDNIIIEFPNERLNRAGIIKRDEIAINLPLPLNRME